MYQNVYKYDDLKRREHMAVRKTAGWYLWTHQLMEVTGSDAAAFLDFLCTKDISNLKVGKERYTTLLNHDAEIIDDVVVFRMADDKFWVSTLFVLKLEDWMKKNQGNYNVEFTNITKQYHMYAVQGPRSLDMVNALVATPVDDLKFFSIADNMIDNIPVKINRAGFTGEKLGYEIYISADKADFLEEKLAEIAPKYDAQEITEFQIMAWTLPTEAGFYYMRDLQHCNPFEVGLDAGINWDKEFIGKEALLKVKSEGAIREMVGFILDDDADVLINGKDQGGSGSPVFLNDEEIGRVSKFNYSYVLEKPIGYLLVKNGIVKEGDIVIVNKRYNARITKTKFLQ